MGLSLLGKFAIVEWRYGLCTENMLLIIQLVFLKLLYSLVLCIFSTPGSLIPALFLLHMLIKPHQMGGLLEPNF